MIDIVDREAAVKSMAKERFAQAAEQFAQFKKMAHEAAVEFENENPNLPKMPYIWCKYK